MRFNNHFVPILSCRRVKTPTLTRCEATTEEYSQEESFYFVWFCGSFPVSSPLNRLYTTVKLKKVERPLPVSLFYIYMIPAGHEKLCNNQPSRSELRDHRVVELVKIYASCALRYHFHSIMTWKQKMGLLNCRDEVLSSFCLLPWIALLYYRHTSHSLILSIEVYSQRTTSVVLCIVFNNSECLY